MKKYIVVAGNIGAGKSTLVEKLSAELGWKPYFEPVSENPYLKDFYTDMAAWAYKCQMYFLSDRLAMHKSLEDYSGSVVQDRSVYEDASIFARNLHIQGHIDKRDFKTYWKLYELIVDMLTLPDVIIYLKASVSTLQKRIALRGRDFESDIPGEYLSQLNSLYEDWIGNWKRCPVLTLNMDSVNFENNTHDFEHVLSRLQASLRGEQGDLFG